jgi:hypothetical protein
MDFSGSSLFVRRSLIPVKDDSLGIALACVGLLLGGRGEIGLAAQVGSQPFVSVSDQPPPPPRQVSGEGILVGRRMFPANFFFVL